MSTDVARLSLALRTLLARVEEPDEQRQGDPQSWTTRDESDIAKARAILSQLRVIQNNNSDNSNSQSSQSAGSLPNGALENSIDLVALHGQLRGAVLSSSRRAKRRQELSRRLLLSGSAADDDDASTTGSAVSKRGSGIQAATRRMARDSLVTESQRASDSLLRAKEALSRELSRAAGSAAVLERSSGVLGDAVGEFRGLGSRLQDSGSVLSRLERRDVTDFLLLAAGFALFIATVAYVVHARMPGM